MKKYSKKKNWKNKYKKIEKLGEGGNANVYKVLYKKDSFEYALKELKDKHKRCEIRRFRFQNEINIIKYHGNILGIIPIINSSYAGYWYVMPIATPILKYLNDYKLNISGKEYIKFIVNGVKQLSETLINLHKNNISHRDIKPDNIYYYNDRFCFGDFGLASHNNMSEHTKSDKALGAIFTIAPEMKRNPKQADGKKADVFSLAKTLWMLIKNNEKGFDGQYNYHDNTHSLRIENEDIHFVELEELITQSTDNDPNNRPNIIEFKNKLEIWLDTIEDYDKVQLSNWNFLNKYIFGNFVPCTSEWTGSNIETIINILNIISILPCHNHMIFPDYGGLDLMKVEKANENGCIYIYADSFCFVVKPKALYYSGFNDYSWNYFMLELDELYPILSNDNQTELFYEDLVEDYPGHYVSGKNYIYGVYDYDKGDNLPEGAKKVERFLKGKFLIVLKNSIYNKASSTYDSRHSCMSHIEFRKYINDIIELSEKMSKEKELEFSDEKLKIYKKNIAISYLENTATNNNIKSDKSEYKPYEVEDDSYLNINFNIYINSTKNLDNNIIKFYFKFIISNEVVLGDLKSSFNKKYMLLSNNGKIRELSIIENESEIYFLYEREKAIEQLEILNKATINLLNLQNSPFSSHFEIEIKKNGKPTHIFTKEELKEKVIMADDRKCNKIVIDENGYIQMLNDIRYGSLYPVSINEYFEPYKCYVGKYSKYFDDNRLDEYYNLLLFGWLQYLKTEKRFIVEEYHFMNNYTHSKKYNYLEKIKKYY